MTFPDLPLSVSQALNHGRALLRQAGIESGALDAQVLLEEATQLPRQSFVLTPDLPLSPPAYHRYVDFLQRRSDQEPVAKIVGRKGFWTHDFCVNSHVLDPRPDSETLIEFVLKTFPQPTLPLSILDLGTGSGALLLTLLAHYPHAWGLGVDKSPQALIIAQGNAARLHLRKRSAFIQGHWSTALRGSFTCVIANPPYIPTADIDHLAPDVRLYDPRMALDGGLDGLDPYRHLATNLPLSLTTQTFLFLEVGQGQAQAVTSLFEKAGWHDASWKNDLGGIARCGRFLWVP